MIRILLLLIGYCFGLFETGYFYGKLHGIDIRSQGSGNSGATNSLRVLGKKAGIIVFLGDALKCHIPAAFTLLYFHQTQPEYAYLYMLYIAFGAILGHNFPFYMGFRGGKGISCMGGLLVLYGWQFMLGGFAVFAGTVAITKYVSVGSILLAVTMFGFGIWGGSSNYFGLAESLLPEFYIICFLISVLAVWQHRANIKRLMSGTENKIGSKKNK